MANMPNRAKQAKKRALEILRKTEPYVSGVNDNGMKILYVLIDTLNASSDELNRAIGEIDNILPQYKETPEKREMEDLLQKVHERLSILKNYRH